MHTSQLSHPIKGRVVTTAPMVSGASRSLTRNGSGNSFALEDIFRRTTKLKTRQLQNSLLWEYELLELESVVGCINTLLDIFHLYGLKHPIDTREAEDKYATKFWSSVDNSITCCLDYIRDTGKGQGAWIKYFKYKICAFFAAWEDQDLPPFPGTPPSSENPKYIFGGVIGTWMHQLRFRNPKKFQSFCLSVLMSKKGMPRADERLVEVAEIKTIDSLTTFKPYIEAVIPMTANFGYEQEELKVDFVITKELIQEQLRRTTREIFAGTSFGADKMSKPFFPSTSSNYNKSRSKGGCVSEILERVMDIALRGSLDAEGPREEHFVTAREVPVKLSGRFTQKYGEEGSREQEELEKRENLIYLDNQFLEYDAVGYQLDPTRFTQMWRRLYWNAYDLATKERPLVEPVGLPEALKIRVITKGPPLKQFACKNFQNFLWKILKRHSVFSLIGRPVMVEDIEAVCTKDPKGRMIISGDYVSSTDNLHSWVSETILEELGDVLHLNAGFQAMCKELLTGHIFEKKIGDTLVEVPQATGQLMGSIISFPFLCIANAALCRWSLELTDRVRYTVADRAGTATCPLRINGDDCLLSSVRQNLRLNWERVTGCAGLESSVGKTYFTDRFAVINSAHFDYVEGEWVSRRFVNMGLVKGITRSGTQGTTLISGLGPKHQELYRYCPEGLWEDANKLFHYYNMNTLKQYSGPWYLPTWVGGLGLVPREDSFSEENLRTCSLIKELIADGLGPMPWPKDKEWYMHELVKERYRSLFPLAADQPYDFIRSHTGTVCRLEEKNSKAYKWITIELLFRSELDCLRGLQGVGKSSKIQMIPQEAERRVMDWNKNLWMDASNLNFAYDLKPMTKNDFEFKPRDPYLPLL